MKHSDAISQGARLIRAGEIVAFPTETVYGLGADATNPIAIKKIYSTKGRPQNNPLIAHISDRKQLQHLVTSIPNKAELLMDAFWPGPLTILFRKQSSVPEIVTAGLDTVGVRMPSHPIALELIRQAKTPIVAPSANPSGKPSGTHHDHIQDYFGDSVFCIPGGSTEIGVESTVITVLGEHPVILRAGAISKENIEQVLGEPVQMALHTDDIPLSPGMKYKHYAPNAPLELISHTAEFQERLDQACEKYSFVGVLGSTQLISKLEIQDNVLTQTLGDRNNLSEISRNLFARLHAFDESKVKIILAERFPTDGIGQAIMDKLTRASEG